MLTRDEGSPPSRSGLEILAERASNVKLGTLFLPDNRKLPAKGLIIQEDLGLIPLRVDDRLFNKGTLAAILRQDPNTQRYTFEFRIYERLQKFREHDTQEVAFFLSDPIGEQERLYEEGGLYKKLAKEDQGKILRLVSAEILARQKDNSSIS